MSESAWLFILCAIYSIFDTISFCKQSDRISKLEWELREIKERKDGADNE